jgi:hypothetical protein
MRITLQYTLTDIRKFDGKFSLLKLPQWPLPNPYKEFVRGNGQIIPASDSTITTHLGKTSISESFICRIKKGLKIPKQLIVEDVTLKNKMSHYFSDGSVLSKYEFVFETAERDLHYSYKKVQCIINKILDLEISVRNKDFRYANYKFKTLFKGLKELLIISSTKRGDYTDEHEKAIIKCTPQIFITLNKNESVSYRSNKSLPITIKDAYDSTLLGWWENFNNNPYKLWLLKNCGPYKNQSLNTLKTGILRIHSEKECVNNVIQSILVGRLKTPPETDESNFLQRFLNDKIRDLGTNYKRINSLDTTTKTIENFIKEAFEEFNPGDIALLNNRMSELKFRPQVNSKIMQHIVYNASFIEKQFIMDNSQSISFGDNANISGSISQTNNNTSPALDYKAIYENLSLLIEKIEQEHDSYEKAVAVESLKNAKASAANQDSKGLASNLKKAGQWTLDFATKLGVNFVSEIIKNHVSH